MRQLDLQPLDAGITLPVVAEAVFRVSASYDPVLERVELKPFNVRLPGLDMAGTGMVFTEALTGKWQGIHRLEMSGEINPTQLMAMLTGTNKLPGDFGVTGPIHLEVKLDHKGSALEFSGTAIGTSAEFRRAERVIKPLGRKFSVTMETKLDERTFELRVSKWLISLGGNMFTSEGTIRDVRKLMPPAKGGAPFAAWDMLANWQW